MESKAARKGITNDNCSLIYLLLIYALLKVDGNEKWGGVGKDIVIQALYGTVAIEGYFKFERVLSL